MVQVYKYYLSFIFYSSLFVLSMINERFRYGESRPFLILLKNTAESDRLAAPGGFDMDEFENL